MDKSIQSQTTPPARSNAYLLWDAWCILSVVGIWPRFIEPNLILTTKLTVSIPGLPPALKGLKILQFSDLHINPQMSDRYLNRLKKKVAALAPDILVFTGDFICCANLTESERLKDFLKTLPTAPCGSYAILGNHDYQEFVSINSEGEYDVIGGKASILHRGFKRLFSKTRLKKKITERAKAVGLHTDLVSMIQETPFQLLHNTTQTIAIKDTHLNICGLGEYMLGKLDPETAFQNYDRNYPGIILAHNPDAVPYLESYPGDIILCGHTHGGQVNIPGMVEKFTLLENMDMKKGLVRKGNKWVYINRGAGSVLQFRWFAPPELLLLTLDS